MRSQKSGKICDGLWYLGLPETGVYLLENHDEYMIISGGMSYIVPAVMQQLKDFGLREDRIKKALILHAHFDHIGIVPYLRRSHPEIKVYASERAFEILANPRAIATINDFARGVAARMGMDDVYADFELDWTVGLKGEKVREGDTIKVGATDLRILETPGHSSCSISAYVPELRALFPSDGGGIPYKGKIVPAANSNYTLYKESLYKLKALPVEYMCADHFGYVYGDEARDYMARSLDAAEEEYAMYEKIYCRTRDIEVAAHEVATTFLAVNPDYFLTFDIYLGICRQTMKHIARCVDGSAGEAAEL
jgi:2-aminobenzoylacetyl-CoA thioesterase